MASTKADSALLRPAMVTHTIGRSPRLVLLDDLQHVLGRLVRRADALDVIDAELGQHARDLAAVLAVGARAHQDDDERELPRAQPQHPDLVQRVG